MEGREAAPGGTGVKRRSDAQTQNRCGEGADGLRRPILNPQEYTETLTRLKAGVGA